LGDYDKCAGAEDGKGDGGYVDAVEEDGAGFEGEEAQEGEEECAFATGVGDKLVSVVGQDRERGKRGKGGKGGTYEPVRPVIVRWVLGFMDRFMSRNASFSPL
jgi:hypothetical protein